MLKTSVSCFEDQHLRRGRGGGEVVRTNQRESHTFNGTSAGEALSGT